MLQADLVVVVEGQGGSQHVLEGVGPMPQLGVELEGGKENLPVEGREMAG